MLILFVLLVVVPLAEIAGFIVIGEAIGLWPTLFTVVATALIGGVLLRQQGLQTLNRARAELSHQRMPMRSLFEGLCLFASGLLLLTPGFFTDLVGFILLVPGVRLLLADRLLQHLERQANVNVTIRGSWQAEPDDDDMPGSGSDRGSGRGSGQGSEARADRDPAEVDPTLPSVTSSQWGKRTDGED